VRVSQTLIVLSWCASYGCQDECKSQPPSFQLDITGMSDAGSIDVVLLFGGERYAKTYDVQENLADGQTSIAVELFPAPSGDFQLDVDVIAYRGVGASGAVIGTGNGHLDGTADGCNRFEIEIARREPPPPPPPPPPYDGGPQPEQDAGFGDTGVPTVCDPICLDPSCNLSCAGSCPSCSLSCNGASTSCNATCNNAETCAIFCVDVQTCESDCKSGSTCFIDCGTTPQCTARCNGGASCMLDCNSSLACAFSFCNGGETACPDGTIACNRACP
jgi:hypothetical protein